MLRKSAAQKRPRSLWEIRQWWLEAVATDNGLTPTALRVATLIGGAVNATTFDTFVGRDTLATRLGVKPPRVSEAVKLLRARGHLQIESRGRQNVYRMKLRDAAIFGPGDAPNADPRASATGTNLADQQVRISASNKYVGAYPNNASTDTEQGEGPLAPSPIDTVDMGYARDAYPHDQESSRVRPANEQLVAELEYEFGAMRDRDGAIEDAKTLLAVLGTTDRVLDRAREDQRWQQTFDVRTWLEWMARSKRPVTADDIPF